MVPITGTFTALTDPVLSQDLVNGDPDLDFGTVVGTAPYSESRTVRFENDGPSNAIEISTATVSGDPAYSLADIAVNGSGGVILPQTLAVGDYIEFTVAASLAAPASGVTGNLVIDTDAVGQDENLSITGTFTEPAAIIKPMSVVSPAGAIYPATTGLIDGVGLSGGGTSGDILSETHAFGASANSWHSNNGNGPSTEMTFDLGGTFIVDSVHIWNDNQNNGVVNRSVKTVDISFSTNGGATFGDLIDDLGDFLLPTHDAGGTGVTPVSTLSFPSAVSGVTHIRLTDFQNHGDAYTAMDEIRFGGSALPPNDPILGQDLVNGDLDLDFGLVAGGGPFSESRTVRFVNDGPTNAIEISSAAVSGDAAYSLSGIAINGSGGISLPQTLAVGDYIEFTVAASVASPAGGLTGSLVIDTDAVAQDKNLPISGTYGTTPKPPPVTNDAPAAGKRVRVTTPGAGYDGNSSVYHTLYLPPEWVPGQQYPVIIEYGGNGWTVEANKLGYYQSAGTGYIWVSMPNIDQNSTLGDKSDDFNTTSWWGSEGQSEIGAADDAAYAMATVIDLIENYGGDHSCVFVTGFSRGAVACGSIGRLDDAMADIWVGFLPHSHHDAWFDTGTRTDRVKGRASFITYGENDGGGGNSRKGVDFLNARGFPVESYELAGTVHTDEWITDASAPLASSLSYTGDPLVSDVRARMRTWMSEIVANKPGTSRISGVVTDASGAPIAGARVQSGLTHWTFTDATGAYELAGLIDGARTVTASHASHQWSPNTLNVTLAGADLTAQNFQATTTFPFGITGMSWDIDDDLIIDFTGPPNSTFEVRKSLDLLVSPFPTTITAQNAPVTTDGSGVGQAIIDAADASGARGFFQLSEPSP
ncbi:carboxypeptidase-like regulatory domain-containing protein [Haloferula sp. A504]|uniref:carboxypeptidase-like regulatory domain-containing protein n=1 Tax=Haloferula sp. A504 TaxID=3373601 RepID=UPI0031C3A42B|nr:carboxypeptidase-like regulatory domain-containing protein [Verrucomicrobiaceae bacterium E54]